MLSDLRDYYYMEVKRYEGQTENQDGSGAGSDMQIMQALGLCSLEGKRVWALYAAACELLWYRYLQALAGG